MATCVNKCTGDLSALFWAAGRGDVQTLLQFSQEDASILANIPDGRQTPLHVSALLGHVLFTEALLHREDAYGLAVRADSSGRTALHLASSEGHIHIVKTLLQVNNRPCLSRDREGRIPLHYAAMRGRTEVVQELVMARPDSLSLGDADESTVFHLCITYNHLHALETLVKLDYATANITAGQPRSPIFTCPDQAGNTIPHLAILLKRVEVVSFLLLFSEIREIANSSNTIGMTAHDILEKSPKDFKSCEIQHILTKAAQERLPPTTTVVVPPQNDGPCLEIFKCIGNLFMKIFRWIDNWLKEEDRWIKEMRGNLSLVSTVIATITFQALINPPGGFIQQGLVSKENTTSSSSSKEVLNNVTSSSYDLLNCTILHDNNTYCPGQAMASYGNSPYIDFEGYLFSVTVSFFTSVSITLLLVSGIFPIKNKAVIWMLTIGMWIALTSLARAYMIAIDIVLPSYLAQGGLIGDMGFVSSMVWKCLLDLIGVLITLRFCIWAAKKCDRMVKKSRRWGRGSGRCRFLSVLLRIIVFLVIVSAMLLTAFYFRLSEILLMI